MKEINTWRGVLLEAMSENGDSFDNLVKAVSFSDRGIVNSELNFLDIEFDSGRYSQEGPSFRLYTKDYIYFPISYDGKEAVDYIPRDPDSLVSPRHFGS